MDVASRQAVYRELFRHEPKPGLVNEIRRATNGDDALRNEGFAAQVTAALGQGSTCKIRTTAPSAGTEVWRFVWWISA